MTYDDEENGNVALLDDEEEQRRRAVLDQPPPSITDETDKALAPMGRAAPQAVPAQSIAGPSESTVQPTSITAGPLEKMGPAAQREHDLLGQGPPQYHGVKKVLDILGRVTAPGAAIEQRTGLGTLGYQSRLGQAAKESADEQTLAKAPLDASYRQAETEEKQALAKQQRARAEALLHPPSKPGAGSKIAFHYSTEDGKTLAVYEDGDTQELPPAKEKEVQEKYPGLTADELAAMPPPNRSQFKSDAEYAQASKAWGQQMGAKKQQDKISVATAGANARGAAMGRNRPVEVLDTWNGNRPIRVSAGEQEDNPDRYVNQTGGMQSLGKQVTIDDIKGALTNLKAATKVLDKGTVNRAAIAAVIADPHATATQFAQSEVAKHLDADEQDYVIALLTAREVLPGLRGLMPTGQATDARVALMLQTLPGPRDPNSEFANKRIDSIIGTLGRVQPGVPNVKPKNNPNAPPEETPPSGAKAKSFKDWQEEQKKKKP